MKIGIITLNGYTNYGNRLQNYALQKVLESYDASVETILVDNSKLKDTNKKNFFEKIKFFLYKKKQNLNVSKWQKKRIDNFKLFSKKYIHETSYSISDKYLHKEELEKFNFFITGSDQVWNPYYNSGSSIYFLEFAPKTKRISYAPSIGINTIPNEYIKNYKKWIQEMHFLSIREEEGAKLIKETSGRDATVLVDPTVLLSKTEWLNISKEARTKPKNNYLLTYFLGGVPEQYQKQIRTLAQENNLEIVNLGDLDEKETYVADPSEFIDYINSCSIFCTDSFHGAVFSILLERPFIIYERMGSSSMYSRITTLLNTFELNSREAKNIKFNEDVFEIDFSHVSTILDIERKKSFDFLANALNIDGMEKNK